jgi:hypothetical protein
MAGHYLKLAFFDNLFSSFCYSFSLEKYQEWIYTCGRIDKKYRCQFIVISRTVGV